MSIILITLIRCGS